MNEERKHEVSVRDGKVAGGRGGGGEAETLVQRRGIHSYSLTLFSCDVNSVTYQSAAVTEGQQRKMSS